MKIVIWGHPLHSNTFSYVHHAFYRAFISMGYETYWMFDNTDISNFNFSNCLFFTEGQSCEKIPIKKDCKYILHNCCQEKFKELPKENILTLQVYTDDVYKHGAKKINNYTFILDRCLFQPWATNLLPNEINYLVPLENRERNINWIGTIGNKKYPEDQFSNLNEITLFIKACSEQKITFQHLSNIPEDSHINLIRKSYLAPQICGEWQRQNGYIPCRIFKNISYGQFGITNSKKVQEVFDGNLIYNSNCYYLFYEAESQKRKQKINSLMKLVREKHTFVNRIKQILEVL